MKSILSAVKILLACGLTLLALPTLAAPVKVELIRIADGWQLKRDGKPFFVKGAGGTSRLDLLAAAGANSVRTWGVDDSTERLLDEAQKNGLTVTVGIWLRHEADGDNFNYDDPAQCKEQLEKVRQAILRYKDHPAVLMWGIGNEMEGYGDGSKASIWKHVNDCAKLAKQLDPNHPVMSVMVEVGGKRVESVSQLCPDLDIVGINSYAGASSLASRYADHNPTKPFVITEYGPPGFWEVGKSSWGAPYEPTSPQKADWYRRAYAGSIVNKPMCLGSYAFLWGNKQESTATWFGLFLPDGSKVNAVDTMTEMWSGKPPKDLCPAIKELKVAGANDLKPGEKLRVNLVATDPANRPLKIRWVVQPEQTKTASAGQGDALLPEMQALITGSDDTHCDITMPKDEGGYRVFAFVNNGVGASVGNVPFHVHLHDIEVPLGKPATLPFYVYQNQFKSTNHYVSSGWMGKTAAIKMVAGCKENPHSPPSCMKFQFTSESDWGGIVWQDPADDWGDRDGGWNLTGAKRLVFWARGENGDEIVSFSFGLLGQDKKFFDSAGGGLEGVTLTKEWKEYAIDLTYQNMVRIKTGFCWTLAGQGHPVTFYLDDILYELSASDGMSFKPEKSGRFGN